MLIAVLIAGILACIAVPQYRKSVVRSKNQLTAAEMRGMARSLCAYYMSTGGESFGDKEMALTGGTTAPGLGYELPVFSCSGENGNPQFPCRVEGMASLIQEPAYGLGLRCDVDENGISDVYVETRRKDRECADRNRARSEAYEKELKAALKSGKQPPRQKGELCRLFLDSAYNEEACKLAAGRKKGDRCVID